MIIRGFIKEVGQTRDWTDKNGDNRGTTKFYINKLSIL